MIKACIEFKDGTNNDEIFLLTPMMFLLLGFFTYEASLQNQSVTVTSVRAHIDGRVSKTHEEGRAVDIRTKDWKINVQDFCNKFNAKYKNYGAIGKTTGLPIAAYFHNSGQGDHIHLQSKD